jgi:transposase
MLGRREPQRSFFDAQTLPHRVAEDSFYGRMGAVSDVLFDDDDLAEMYCADNGRSSLPPSLMCGILILQFHDDVSDAEAVERTMYDLRWKVALDLPLDFPGFDPSSLSVFRKRTVEHGQERYAFDRFVQAGRTAGFIPDKVTLLTDTTPVKGAGAVQDTYTLLRKGTRKLLRALGYHLPGKRRGLSEQAKALVVTYVDQDRKADIDWTDSQQRKAHLQTLVQDVEAALEFAAGQMDDDEVRAIGWLLTKILGDDLEEDDTGGVRIAEGTAADRVISVTDPAMRHGHKSASQRFDGFKVSVTTEQSSELIVDIADLAANDRDGKVLMPVIERAEQHTDMTVERVIGDGAYNSADNLAACSEHPAHPVDLVGPFYRPADPEVAKSAFHIDLPSQMATCPEGHAVEGRPVRDDKKRPVLRFTFPRAACEACPRFARCVRSKTHGRTVTTHAHEALLRQARARQETAEFQALYRLRSAVERKIGELVYHGLRNTRYLGEQKRHFQRLWTGAAVNLKRLFTLAEEQHADLRAVFTALGPPVASGTPA